MSDMLKLTKTQIRKIVVHAAGLARKAEFGTGIDAVYRVIDHLGFVQLDTNFVVERAHHQVMFARIPDYEKQWLAELVEEGLVYEYLTSDAGYLPMHDFRYSLPVKESFANNGKPLSPAESRLMSNVLDRVEREGPLTVGDFDDDRIEASTGWWDWRPAKVALERLYLEGKLMVTRSKTFKKNYDLPLNLVPAETDQTAPSAEEFARYVIRRTLGGLGVAYGKEIAWRARRVKGNLVKKVLEEMVANGELRSVTVDGLKTAPLYMLSEQAVDIEIAGDVFILSPFDILNVFRHRLKDFFDFDYQIECFVPAPKRKFGYFSLPVLAGDAFIARMDAKADRKQKMLIVHNLYFEDVNLNDQLIGKFVEALKAFVLFNQCRDIRFVKTNNNAYIDAIRHMLSE
ncbi:winged helix-turn-helix domain-containing protein [Mucilaginibacter sp. Mucisp84]|uniref:winged helix-turn-helix domain-containing protein n=1 Tax=Mucilaginibacter sp. Mucisp84 TaxID=3243058 RepID=UPI0039A71343